MGLLNHLFGGKKGCVKELQLDSKERLSLWKKHLEMYVQRREKAKFFNNPERVLHDISGLDNVLGEMEELVHEDILDIGNEEKDEQEIISDLKKFSADKSDGWLTGIGKDRNLEENVLKIFKQIHKVLRTELHFIKLLRKEKRFDKEKLDSLFYLVFHTEFRLNRAFDPETFFSKAVPSKVDKAVQKILMGLEIKKEKESAEEKFVNSAVDSMGKEYSKHYYRKLGEEIYDELLDMAGAPISTFDEAEKVKAKFEGFVKSEALVRKIMKKLRPKFNDARINLLAAAFKKAVLEKGHFNERDAGLFT